MFRYSRVFFHLRQEIRWTKRASKTAVVISRNVSTSDVISQYDRDNKNLGVAGKPWKEASVLIPISARRSAPQINRSHIDFTRREFDILMLKKSSRNKYLPAEFSFPGGNISQIDSNQEWTQLFKRFAGVSGEVLSQQLHIPGDRPAMISNPLTPRDRPTLATDISFRITAIRETFKQTGLILLCNKHLPNEGDVRCLDSICVTDAGDELRYRLSEWRQKVVKDDSYFYEMCECLRMVPNVWSLVEWSNWLTPDVNSVYDKTQLQSLTCDGLEEDSQRTDSLYYLCFLDEFSLSVGNGECDASQQKLSWKSAEDFLRLATTGRTVVTCPLSYELSRLCQFSHLDSLRNFSFKREPLGLSRNLESIVRLQDGIMFVLPGDEFYPSDPDLADGYPQLKLDKTVRDCLDEDTNKHRIIRAFDSAAFIECNVEVPNGHLRPALPDLLDVIQRLDLHLGDMAYP